MIAVLLAVAGAAMPPAVIARPAAPFACGAVERPGIAERGGDGVWRGAAVDLCRQSAQAEQGADAAIAFHAYRRIEDLRHARQDALAVLSRAELAIALPFADGPSADGPSANAPSGLPVAISRQLLLVRPGTTMDSQSGLAGHKVCFIVASAAEAALNARSRAMHIAIQRVGFQEPVELRDAFDAGYCAAMAVDANDIPGGGEHTVPLGPALAELPLFMVKSNSAATR